MEVLCVTIMALRILLFECATTRKHRFYGRFLPATVPESQGHYIGVPGVWTRVGCGLSIEAPNPDALKASFCRLPELCSGLFRFINLLSLWGCYE